LTLEGGRTGEQKVFRSRKPSGGELANWGLDRGSSPSVQIQWVSPTRMGGRSEHYISKLRKVVSTALRKELYQLKKSDKLVVPLRRRNLPLNDVEGSRRYKRREGKKI